MHTKDPIHQNVHPNEAVVKFQGPGSNELQIISKKLKKLSFSQPEDAGMFWPETRQASLFIMPFLCLTDICFFKIGPL